MIHEIPISHKAHRYVLSLFQPVLALVLAITEAYLNFKLDYSLTNEQSGTNPYTDVIIGHDGQQRERDRQTEAY